MLKVAGRNPESRASSRSDHWHVIRNGRTQTYAVFFDCKLANARQQSIGARQQFLAGLRSRFKAPASFRLLGRGDNQFAVSALGQTHSRRADDTVNHPRSAQPQQLSLDRSNAGWRQGSLRLPGGLDDLIAPGPGGQQQVACPNR